MHSPFAADFTGLALASWAVVPEAGTMLKLPQAPQRTIAGLRGLRADIGTSLAPPHTQPPPDENWVGAKGKVRGSGGLRKTILD